MIQFQSFENLLFEIESKFFHVATTQIQSCRNKNFVQTLPSFFGQLLTQISPQDALVLYWWQSVLIDRWWKRRLSSLQVAGYKLKTLVISLSWCSSSPFFSITSTFIKWEICVIMQTQFLVKVRLHFITWFLQSFCVSHSNYSIVF